MSGDDVPQKLKQQIDASTLLLTVISGMDGFFIIDLISEQHSYKTQDFLSNTMEPPFRAIFPDGRGPQVSMHLENSRVHRPKASDAFLLKIALFECSIRHLVLMWHPQNSGFSTISRAHWHDDRSLDRRTFLMMFKRDWTRSTRLTSKIYFSIGSSQFGWCGTSKETTSMNKPSIMTVHPRFALLCLWPRLIDPLIGIAVTS
jgi:hypothetical protein